MPTIKPFKGWRYNLDLIPDFSQVIIPPYDVISTEDQDQFYRVSPYNFIRILLNRSSLEARYQEAAEHLQEWKRSGVLIQDPQESFYLLAQSFSQGEETIHRVGLVAALELEEFGNGVLPHEQTNEKHLLDRYRLMETTHTNPGQIFMSYQDKSMTLESLADTLINTPPVIDTTVLENVRYRLWPIQNQDQVISLQSLLGSRSAFIADGHHRYKTALRYAKNHPQSPDSQWTMVTLINAYNPGMGILPTHRLVRGVDLSIDAMISALNTRFQVSAVPSIEQALEILDRPLEPPVQFGLYHRPSESAWVLTFTDETSLAEDFSGHSDAFQNLPVNILHRYVLKEVLDLDSSNQDDLNRLDYIRGNESPVDLLRKKTNYDVACFVAPPDPDTVFSIARAGEIMPQKSTFFYPKIYSGLVIRCFDDYS